MYAFPIKLTNTRPLPATGSAAITHLTQEVNNHTTLQDDLNQIYGAGVVPAGNQLSLAVFKIPDAVSIKLTLRFDDSQQNLAASTSFGIFGLGSSMDSSTLQTLNIFKTPDTPGAVATISKTAGGVKVSGLPGHLCNNAAVNCAATAPISFSYFGFYISRPRGITGKNDTGTDGFKGDFWTADQLNTKTPTATSKGTPQALIYQGSNPSQWTVAFDNVHNVQKEFNDFIVTMNVSKSLSAVPEPGALFLFGTAVLGCVTMLRRKMRDAG
jgi:PEP-CTERM motif